MKTILNYENGDRYEGDVENGLRDGFGVYFYSNGKSSYSGQWLKDEKDGWGLAEDLDGKMKVQSWSNGKLVKEFNYVEISSENGNYVGGINSLGEKEGFGIYNWKNGDEYIGEWSRGIKEGNGDYTWSNGARYSGEWQADKFNGEGTFVWPDGDKYFGNWLNDMREGAGVFIDAKGKEVLQEWHNGKMKVCEQVETGSVASRFKKLISLKNRKNQKQETKERGV